MPHFARTLLGSDPDALENLREVLHGAQAETPAMPNLAERFGGPQGTSETVKALRKPRRRRQTAAVPAGSLVTP